MPPEGLTTRAAAAKLGVSPGMVRLMLRDGRLEGWSVGARLIVSAASVERYRERNAIVPLTRRATPPPARSSARARLEAL